MSEKPTTKIGITVASGLLLAGLTWLFKSYLKTAAVWVWGCIVAAWGWLFSGHSVPGWAIIILGFSLFLVFLAAIRFIRQRGPTGPDYRSFREIFYYSFRWRWDYDSRGDVRGLHPFCPDNDCDMQVFPERVYNGNYRSDTTRLTCERCRHTAHIEENPDRVDTKVILEIQRLLRTGQWLANQKAQQGVHGNGP